MAFSIAERRATNYRQIFADTSSYSGWPTFFPGARALAFALGDRAYVSGQEINAVNIRPIVAVD